MTASCCDFRLDGFRDVIGELNDAVMPSIRRGSHRTSSSASRCSVKVARAASPCDPRRPRALARDGRGGGGRQHRALRRLVARARRGPDERPERQTVYVVTVNGRAARCSDRARRRVRHRRALPRLAAAASLHPTIGVHARLPSTSSTPGTAARSAAASTTLPTPADANYDVFPVNAYEAESRRLARFFRIGHTPGRMQVQPAVPSRELPFTLDLRRCDHERRHPARRCVQVRRWPGAAPSP